MASNRGQIIVGKQSITLREFDKLALSINYDQRAGEKNLGVHLIGL